MEKKRILVIDDEEGLTRLLKLNLEQRGTYEVRTESRGALGLAAAREFKPALILLDVIMPDMDGGDIASQIQADQSLVNIPIVFLTAVVSREEAEAKGGMIGGHPFIAKPVSIEHVIECIEQYARP